ncbi:MAG: ATP-binding protein [Desulfobacteraceae bacterium]|nr:ATP-binding protein [Desulfobacteraceae bacterium]
MTYNLQSYIERLLTETLRWSLANFSVTALLGPRQCGKSTLARHVVEDYEDAVFIDLEKPSDLRKLEDAEFFFHTQKGKLLCIDEVQRRPELFPLLRVVVDEDRRPGKFLILGSASPDLIRHGSETLAGRIHFLELTPFTYDELVVADRLKYQDPARIWVRGGFPESVLAVNENVSLTWRQDFIRTFLERDIPQFGFSIPATTMRRFWVMLAHFHGQVFNASKLGQSLGVTHPTIRKYLDIMEQTYMVRILLPLAANLKKRLVKSPKIYIRDSGILHALLEIRDIEDLLGHPVVGASWEGWCLEQILAVMPDWRPCYYRTSSGEEIDLILERGRRRLAFEFKASMSPKVSRGFPATLDLLQPERTWIVAPVREGYPRPHGVTVANMEEVLKDLREIMLDG